MDDASRWLELRHQLAPSFGIRPSDREGTLSREVTLVSNVFTPPRECVREGVREAQPKAQTKKRGGQESLTALRLVAKAVLVSLGLFLLLALMYTLATLIFGRGSAVCIQEVPHGQLKPGLAGDRPRVTCEQGYWFNKVLADTLRCQLVRKRCVGAWKRRSCDETWMFTTAALAKAAQRNSTKETINSASRVMDSLCFEGKLPGTSQLYLRVPQTRRSSDLPLPSAAGGILVLGSLALLVATAAGRARNLTQPPHLGPDCALDIEDGADSLEAPMCQNAQAAQE